MEKSSRGSNFTIMYRTVDWNEYVENMLMFQSTGDSPQVHSGDSLDFRSVSRYWLV